MTASDVGTTARARTPDRGRAWLRGVTVAVLVVGVVCQLVQGTDPAPALTYYTVDSAILLAATLIVASARPGWAWVDGARGAATSGVVLSGLVFATVIAPATPTGTWIQPHDDAWVRVANVLLHGVGPVLATADYLVRPQRGRRGTFGTALRWCLWPLVYFAVVLPLDLAGQAHVPYPFLDVHEAGWTAVLGAVAGLFVVVLGLGAALVALHRRLGRGSPGHPAR
ncbi:MULTISPECIES: Pr6Pr family membrane protein [Cellulosimicrobium]|uniref:Pr6Pr family membrane protein n=1 Tax=Cellulosimicrobium TaxID=157920 RepID=UPI002096D89F|nr:Pr6Pr family membrane protein [Cellulosimicrobium cellulans]MCO7274074.1 Pr6Pr family membrane protein [Cellulosimicrobium cellulans]